jgi:general secretion pathway protein J
MSASARDPGLPPSGFTLVEVLVALTIFSLILTLAVGSLHSAGRTLNRVDDQIRGTDHRRLAMSFLRRHLEQAVPLVRLDGREEMLLFEGRRDWIRFVSRLPNHRGGGLYVFTLRPATQTGVRVLSLTYAFAHPDTIDAPVGAADADRTLALVGPLRSVAIDYFGRETPDDPPAWHPEWRDRHDLPELVRLRIVAGDPASPWPDLVVAPRTHVIKRQPQFVLRADGSGNG